MSHWNLRDFCKGRTLATHSATTTAFVELGRRLGYTLVLAIAPDLYFVRNDVLEAANVTFVVDRIPNGPALPAACVEHLHKQGFRSSRELLKPAKGVVGTLQRWVGG